MEVTVGGRGYMLSETLHSDELAPIFADAWTASRVWFASRFLSERLVSFAQESHSEHSFEVANGASVIELGSGCGLVGLVAAVLGANVLLTDQREAVELLQRNAKENMTTADEQQRVLVAEYQWGTPPAAAPLPHATYDYVLISDCINPIYGAESWRNLARSINMLSNDSTITYLAHEARGDDEAMTDFQAYSADFLNCERIAHLSDKRLSLFKIRRRTGLGIFWGEEGIHPQHTALPAIRSGTTARQPKSRRRANATSRKAASLPDLGTASNKQLVAQRETSSAPVHASTLSLLTVLQTLWRSVAADTHNFVEQIIDGKEIPLVDEELLKSPYFNSGVYQEDSAYFLRERKAELHRATVRQQAKAYRELHCATDDTQKYLFDRRDRMASSKVARKCPSMKAAKEHIENRLIDRHDHKIRHLLHILQDEITNETRREIRALNYWSPQKPLSRQSKRHIADIIKERYEAADRIMRILEEYHVVVGVDAAKYLEATIAEGNALTDSQ